MCGHPQLEHPSHVDVLPAEMLVCERQNFLCCGFMIHKQFNKKKKKLNKKCFYQQFYISTSPVPQYLRGCAWLHSVVVWLRKCQQHQPEQHASSNEQQWHSLPCVNAEASIFSKQQISKLCNIRKKRYIVAAIFIDKKQ